MCKWFAQIEQKGDFAAFHAEHLGDMRVGTVAAKARSAIGQRRHMMIRKSILAGIPLVSIALALAACGGAPAEETSGESAEALAYLPNGMCTLVDGPGVGANIIGPNQLAAYEGSDPNVLSFLQDARLHGGKQTWWIRAHGGNAWLGEDMTGAYGQQIPLTDRWKSVSPVFASYYECTWNWDDYQLPRGGTRPYMPTDIVVYDPGCTKLHCEI